MKRYKVIRAKSIEDLCKAVESALAEGWELVGGVSMDVHECMIDVTYRYAQALTKAESTSDSQSAAEKGR